MINNHLFTLVLLFAFCFSTAPGFSSEIIENFEEYETGRGLPNDHPFWTTWDASGKDGTITNAYAYNGAQCLRLDANSDVLAQMDIHDGVWEITCMMLIPPDFQGTCYFMVLNEYEMDPASANDLFSWALALQIDAVKGVIEGPRGSAPLVTSQWSEIKVIVDLNNNLQHVFYHGTPLALEIAFAPNEIVKLAAVEFFASSDSSSCYIDAFSVMPSTIDVTNIASDGEASQSTTCYRQKAEHAVDKDFSTCTQTCVGDSEPWWRLDFESNFIINRLILHRRNDLSQYGLKNLSVTLLDAEEQPVFASGVLNPDDTMNDPEFLALQFDDETICTSVVIRKENSSANEILSLGEVQVFSVNTPPSAPAITGTPKDTEVTTTDAPYLQSLTITGYPTPEITVTPDTIEYTNGVLRFETPPLGFTTITVTAQNSLGSAETRWTLLTEELVAGQLTQAGELFVDLSADDATAGTAAWHNTGTLAAFQKVGSPYVTTMFGAPAVSFNNDLTNDAYQCSEPAPYSLTGTNPTRSIEVWVLNEFVGPADAMVAWGHRGGPAGSNMAFHYGANKLSGAANHWGNDHYQLSWINYPVHHGPPSPGTWHHLVYTYDGRAFRVYCDGEEWSSTTLDLDEMEPLNTHTGTGITIGAEVATADGLPLWGPQAGSLYIGRVRVHDLVLIPNQIRHNYTILHDHYQRPPSAPVITNVPAADFYYPESTLYQHLITATGMPRPELSFEVNLPPDIVEAVLEPDGLLTCDLKQKPSSFTISVTASNTEGETTASWTVYRVTPGSLTAAPAHRYSFETDAGDEIGDAHGTSYGNVTFEEGRAILHNEEDSDSSARSPFPDPLNPGKESPGAYIDLPNNIISALGAQASFEAWIAWNGPAALPGGQKVFDFGTSDEGENYSTGGTNNNRLSATVLDEQERFSFGFSCTMSEDTQYVSSIQIPALPADGTVHHVVCVWEETTTTTVSLYLNGRLQVIEDEPHMTLSQLNDINNWLGRSQEPDPLFNGSFLEFRIYRHALTNEEVLGNFQSGPDVVTFSTEGAPVFTGDANCDNTLNIADAVFMLSYLFNNSTPCCLRNMNVNGDNAVNIADTVALLSYLFSGTTLFTPDNGFVIDTPGCRIANPELISSELLECNAPCTGGE